MEKGWEDSAGTDVWSTVGPTRISPTRISPTTLQSNLEAGKMKKFFLHFLNAFPETQFYDANGIYL